MADSRALSAVSSLRCLFPSGHLFFGLDQSHREVQLEQFYILMKHLTVSYDTLKQMPIRFRDWFINRIIKDHAPKNTTNTGGIEIDDDTPISQVLGKMNN